METRYLYLDESGDPGWTPEHGGNSDTRYFVYAGVCLTPKQNYQINQDLYDVISEHFDNSQKQPEEIHYADACHGNGRYGQLSNNELEQLRSDVFEYILDLEPTLMGTVVDKNKLKDVYEENANNPKKLAFRATVERFHKDLKNDDKLGYITIDEGIPEIDKRLRNLVYRAQDGGIKIEGNRSNDTELPRLLDTISLSPSEMSPGVQLADVVAYNVAMEYKRLGGSGAFDAIEHLMSDPPGVDFKEPSVVPQK